MSGFKSKYSALSQIEVKVVIAVLAIILGIVGFIIIAGFVTRGSTENFDMRVLRSFRHPNDLGWPIGPLWFFEAMRDITSLGSGVVVAIITAIVIGYTVLRKQYNLLVLILAAVIGGAVMDLELKQLFARIRPDLVPSLIAEKSYSFPSGHSMMSAIIYLSLAAIIARMQVRWRDKIYIISVAVLLSLIIGVSRVYLGVHYPTDVLAGWFLGMAWAALCWLVAWFISKKSDKRLSGNGR